MFVWEILNLLSLKNEVHDKTIRKSTPEIYSISSISLRAYYYFSKSVDAQTIQGGTLIKGVDYYFEFWTLKVL